MKIRVQDGLPFVTVSIVYKEQKITLNNVVLDTGSVGCVFMTETMAKIGLTPESKDMIRQVKGIGGVEFVIMKQADKVILGDLTAENFTIEIGAMDYGFDFDEILGFDFLQQTGAVIDLASMDIYPQI